MKPPRTTPAPGQVWRDCDPRRWGRHLLILEIGPDPRRWGPEAARCVAVVRGGDGWWRVGRTLWIQPTRFRGSARTGYALVDEGVGVA